MDLMKMMKQAQELQSKMQAAQAELGNLEISGAAGAGLVVVTLTGKGALKGVTIDPSLIKPDEVEILEDLIVAAHNDAKAKVEQAMQEKMKAVTGDLPLPPGMNPF